MRFAVLNHVFEEECWRRLLFFRGSSAHRQQERKAPAPETAPPLFPGGGLISYNSIFTTRGLTA